MLLMLLGYFCILKGCLLMWCTLYWHTFKLDYSHHWSNFAFNKV